jgi:hypothetical protein
MSPRSSTRSNSLYVSQPLKPARLFALLATDVADRDDLNLAVSQEAAQVRAAHVADADEADRDALARRPPRAAAEGRRGHEPRRRQRGGGARELAAGDPSGGRHVG